MIKLQVRVLKLTKMHDYSNVPPCIICTPCIIWFRHGTSGIFGLRAFRKYTPLCLSNVHNKEYRSVKKKCIFLYILMWNIFSDLYVTCGHCVWQVLIYGMIFFQVEHQSIINILYIYPSDIRPIHWLVKWPNNQVQPLCTHHPTPSHPTPPHPTPPVYS